jgi:hypothetical protein
MHMEARLFQTWRRLSFQFSETEKFFISIYL